MMRRSSRQRVACERLRARRKLGTAIAASKAMMATTIMISTRVKPPRFLFSFCNIAYGNEFEVKFEAVDLKPAARLPFQARPLPQFQEIDPLWPRAFDKFLLFREEFPALCQIKE